MPRLTPTLINTLALGAGPLWLAAAVVVTLGLLSTLVACAPQASSGATDSPDKTSPVYVSTTGSKDGNGTKERPLDLATALSKDSPARPGDTVWVQGGTYKGTFTSHLTGTSEAPITVRPVRGEHVVIDSAPSRQLALEVWGAWAVYRDLEITNSDSLRSSAEPGSAPAELRRGGGIDVRGPNTKIVNMVIHDLAGGIGMWRDAVDAEAYGNIIFYNGWSAGDRSHGHGIYTQNETGVRLVTDNVVFGQFGSGIHAYGSDQAFLNHINLEGNVVFNNGIVAGGTAWQILVGGGRLAKAPVLKANYTYAVPENGATSGNNIGYNAGCDGLVMQDNYFVDFAGGHALQLVNCWGTLERNALYGGVRGIEDKTIVPKSDVERRYPDNTYQNERPTGVVSFVRPNRYEPGRAHVVVYNWDKADDVTVDLTAAGLPSGARFELRDVQNLNAPPIVSAIYADSPVRIPIATLTETAPVVGLDTKPPHSAPDFAVFLLTSSPPAPTWFHSMLSWLGARQVVPD